MIHVPSFVFIAYLTFSIVGLAPFSTSSEFDAATAASGSVLRPIILGVASAMILPWILVQWRRGFKILTDDRWLILIVLWSGLSIAWAIAPDVALRRWILAVIVIFLSVSLSALVNNTREIHKIALIATGMVMLANYACAVVFPDVFFVTEARGTYWTGMHPHKNNAGLIAALSVLIWWFAAERFSHRWILWAGTGLWLLFLSQTGSRTSQFALVVAIGCTVILSFKNRYLRLSAITAVIAALLVGILSVLAGLLPGESVMATLFGDTTFTGRTVLWQFLVTQIHERPFQGVGIGSFWGVNDSALFRANQTDWFATAAQGHNGYLDVTVTLGIVGLILFVAWIIAPFRSIIGNNAKVAAGRRVFCAIWIFALIHNCAESTLFRGDSILWILTLISVIVLRGTPQQSPVATLQSKIVKNMPLLAAHSAREPAGR